MPFKEYHQGVKDAVIPAAGSGTRMQSVSGGQPKELLPVRGIPLIVHTLQEAIDAGITRIFIIISPHKPEIRELLESTAQFLVKENTIPFNNLTSCGVECIFLEQNQPLGLAQAISLVEPYVGINDFLSLMPDNFYPNRPAPALQLIQNYKPGRCCLGVLKLTPDILPYFSDTNIVRYENGGGKTVKILFISDKKGKNFPAGRIETLYRAVGRSIYSQDFMKVFHSDELEEIKEMDDFPVIQRLTQEGKADGCILTGTGFDAGNPAGYAAATQYVK